MLFRFEASISTSQTLVERRCLRLDGWTLIYAAFEGSDSIAASPKGKGTAPLQFIVGISADQVVTAHQSERAAREPLQSRM